MRGDCGTENVFVAGVQRFLRRDSQDDFAGFKSFMYGTSVANQVCDKFMHCFFGEVLVVICQFGLLAFGFNA